jgi:hypothetical protein
MFQENLGGKRKREAVRLMIIPSPLSVYRRHDSATGVAKLYCGLGSPVFDSRKRQKVSLLDNVQTGFGAHPAYFMVNTVLSR